MNESFNWPRLVMSLSLYKLGIQRVQARTR